MSWGHAVSEDLFHWQHLPVALPESDGVMAFSGSAVSDTRNTSGLGADGKGPLVAVDTSRTESDQTQSIAYSHDRGRTWRPYEGNPVLDDDDPAFRDPKVFWHAATGRWIMAVVLADQRKVRLYGSQDLKAWTRLSEFGPEGAHPVRNWECPDLFELPVDGEPGESRWILQVDSSRGHPWGGSGCQYFVGSFDGVRFVNENPPETALWLDWGRDFYAAQSFAGVPPSDGRRLVIGWISNWMYARKTPTSPWRGAQSVPRELRLKRFPEGLRLVQRPAREIAALRSEGIHLENLSVPEANREIAAAGFAGGSVELQAELEIGSARAIGLRLLQGGDETFAGRHAARLPADGGRLTLRVLVDQSVVEVFAQDGRATLTDRVFPSAGSRGVSLFEDGGSGRVVRLDGWRLRSVWD